MDEQQTANTPTAGAPIYQQSQEKNAKWLWLLIVLIVIGALAFAFFRGIGPFANISPFVKQEVSSPTPFVQSSPTASSPSPISETEIDKTQPAIRVLNGSGIAGLASSAKDFLENLGWRVTSVGNAQAYDFDKTQVRLKDGFVKYQEALVGDLSDKYSVEVSSDSLSSTDSADIEVIVGKK